MKNEGRATRHFRLILAAALLFAAIAVSAAAVSADTVTHKTVYNGVDWSAVYDYDYYAAKRGMTGQSDDLVLKDFVTYGIPNTVQAKADFDVRSYWRGNQDIRVYYHRHLVPSIVNVTNYHNAMKKMWYYVYRHYCLYGQREASRRGTTTGITEIKNPVTVYNGTDWSPVYNYSYYCKVCPGVKSVKYYYDDDIATLEHFIRYGTAKQLRGNASFNVKPYRYGNPDLRIAFGTNYQKYYLHYIQFGRREGGRKDTPTNAAKYNQQYMISHAITYYKVNGTNVNFSSIYDFKWFRTRYTKYADDDAGAIKYFVNSVLIAHGQGNSSSSSTKSTAYTNLFKKVYPTAADEYAVARKYTSSTNYLFIINKTKCHVYVFKKVSGNWTLLHDFPCCVGKSSTKTNSGVYKLQDCGYYFNTGSRRCFYWSRIYGSVLFHSVIYYQDSSPLRVSDGTMGKAVSHGCVRLPLTWCKWIYDNNKTLKGSTIVIYGNP